jgi:hypothetical protein
MYIYFQFNILKERECLGDLEADVRLMFKRVNEHGRRVRSGVVWVSVGINGGCCVWMMNLLTGCATSSLWIRSQRQGFGYSGTAYLVGHVEY